MVKLRLLGLVASAVALSTASLAAFSVPASAAPSGAAPSGAHPSAAHGSAKVRPLNVPTGGDKYIIVDQANPSATLRLNSDNELIQSTKYSTVFIYNAASTQIRVAGTNDCLTFNNSHFPPIYDTVGCSEQVESNEFRFLSGNTYTVMTTLYQEDSKNFNPANCMFGSGPGGLVSTYTCDASDTSERWEWLPVN